MESGEEQAHHGGEAILWFKTRVLSLAMGGLLASQESLLKRLKGSSSDGFPPEVYGKLANDLRNVVSLTNSFIDEAYDMPVECLSLWAPRLEKIADLNGYLDNFAETFRIASDDACTALLADIAVKVAANDLMSSH